MSGRILVIGDIHGCALTLESMIDQLEIMHDDRVVFLGDYVDRGDKVFQTVERLIDLKDEYGDNITFIMGNHEEMFIRYLKLECRMDELRMFLYNGGRSTIKSYLEGLGYYDKQDITWEDLPDRHKEFYSNLKVMHEIDQYVFVHAGIRPQVALYDQVAHDVIWIREEFLYWPYEILEGRVIVHGHTPMEKHEIDHYHEKYSDRINLDTACVFGYELTCRDLTNNKEYKIKCRDRRIS